MPNVCTALIFSEGEQGETLNVIAIPCLFLLKDPRRGGSYQQPCFSMVCPKLFQNAQTQECQIFWRNKTVFTPSCYFQPNRDPQDCAIYQQFRVLRGNVVPHDWGGGGGGGGYRNKEGCAPLRAAGQSRPCVQPFEEAADVQPPTALPLMCSPPAGARSWPLPSLQHDQK